MKFKHYLILVTIVVGITFGITISGSVSSAIDGYSYTRTKSIEQSLKQQQAEWQQKQIVVESTRQAKIDTINTLLYNIRVIAPVALMAIICISLYLFSGWTKAEVKKANFEATQIRMDPKTMTFPIVFFEAGGKLRLHDPNNKTTMALDKDHDAIPMLAAYSTAVQLQTVCNKDQPMIDMNSILEISDGR